MESKNSRLSITIRKKDHKELKEYCKKNELLIRDYILLLHREHKSKDSLSKR